MYFLHYRDDSDYSKKGKNWTCTVPHERFVDPVKQNIMLFDFESLHLIQTYIKSINFPRDYGEN